MIQPGAPVTVAVSDMIFTTTVATIGGRMSLRKRREVEEVRPGFFAGGVWLAYVDEGVTWCRGWDGEAADALKAAAALR